MNANPVFWVPISWGKVLEHLNLCLIARETTRDYWTWDCLCRLSRRSTARGSSAGFSWVSPIKVEAHKFSAGFFRISPTKVEACKYFLFTESSLG